MFQARNQEFFRASEFSWNFLGDLPPLPLQLRACYAFTSNNFYDYWEVTFTSKRMTCFVYDDSIVLKRVISEVFNTVARWRNLIIKRLRNMCFLVSFGKHLFCKISANGCFCHLLLLRAVFQIYSDHTTNIAKYTATRHKFKKALTKANHSKCT